MTTRKLKSIQAVYERGPDYVNANELDKFTSSRNVFEWAQKLKDQTKEMFLALHLDSKNRLLCVDVVSIGSLNASIVHPREVFKMALLSNAASILLIHNHPSGDPNPSREDLDLTKQLSKGSEMLGVRILDHVIIGDNQYCSLADRGLLT